jgi:hypothetical protein
MNMVDTNAGEIKAEEVENKITDIGTFTRL